MDADKVIGIILSILLIILISVVLVFCLGCHRLIKVYPEPAPKNKFIVSV